jgi:hypothetical protein
MFAARLERTDRAEEEPLLDPFRVARPASDLNSIGLSRWVTATASLSLSAWRTGALGIASFVEVAQVNAAPGNPAGLFEPELRYGARTMWMYTIGLRMRAGSRHVRMGRYGVAGTREHGAGSEMSSMSHSSSSSCPQ